MRIHRMHVSIDIKYICTFTLTYSISYHINHLSLRPPGIYLPTLPPKKKLIQEGLVPEGFMMPLVSKAHVDRSDPWTADVETVWMTLFMESCNTVCWRLFVVTLGKNS